MNNVRKLWENSNITTLFNGLDRRVRFDEPMSTHTSFAVGGPADIFIEPAGREELIAIIDFFVLHTVPVSILGGGSNLLVSDKGIRGAVISLSHFNTIEHVAQNETGADRLSSNGESAHLVRVGAGSSVKTLTEWCASENLSGMERFAGLPGTVGGAVFMNARCYEISVSDVFFTAEVLHFSNCRCIMEQRTFSPEDWSYKKSPFQNRTGSDPLVLAGETLIVLSAVFALFSGEESQIREKMNFYAKDREEKGHFRFPSAGSMFKNNHAFGKPSGKIIDEVGLRGFRIGDAQVAPWHGNFVINAGNATAQDIRQLVEEVRLKVFAKTGFSLESEVLLVGDW